MDRELPKIAFTALRIALGKGAMDHEETKGESHSMVGQTIPDDENTFHVPNHHQTDPHTSMAPEENLPQKPLPARATDQSSRANRGPLSPVTVNRGSYSPIPQASSVQVEEWPSHNDRSRPPSVQQKLNPEIQGSSRASPVERPLDSPSSLQLPLRARLSPTYGQRSDSPRIITPDDRSPKSRTASYGSADQLSRTPEPVTGLQYHHRAFSEDSSSKARNSGQNSATGSPSQLDRTARPKSSSQHLMPSGQSLSRPSSAISLGSDRPGRHGSPRLSPNSLGRPLSSSNRSPDNRPLSYSELLNAPYPQTAPAPANLDNANLRMSVGINASLLSSKQTLEMYSQNVKKTNDPAVQYEFAIFMINAAQEASNPHSTSQGGNEAKPDAADLLHEARHILQKLSDRSYPFAQYYLADGYASGLFNKGKPDNDRAFTLFVAASKHGHAEAGYRTALCYEFAWGTRKDPAKAVQFYRQAASKNHPGAMSRLGRACLLGDLGLGNRYREGLKWLKRAAESADFQYNSAPYDLGLLHESGYGDDVFVDEAYAAQLFTQSADLGHAEANYRLGDAYEHGKLKCPTDPALSVHFYTGAATRGHALAMMALCAWYMVGAEPVLEKDENEAYEWARKAAECGMM